MRGRTGIRNGLGGLSGDNGLSTFALAAQGLANRVCAVRRQFISLEIRAGWIHMLRKFRGDWLLALLGFFTERFAKCGRVELRGSPFEDAHRVEGVIVFQPYNEIRFELGEIRFKVVDGARPPQKLATVQTPMIVDFGEGGGWAQADSDEGSEPQSVSS